MKRKTVTRVQSYKGYYGEVTLLRIEYMDRHISWAVSSCGTLALFGNAVDEALATYAAWGKKMKM